jgi:DNA-binding NtrC family response regulator
MRSSEKINILILDDDKDFTEELRELLENSGMNAIEANTAEKGFQILDSNEFDLLILDVRLGVINGLDVLEKVKSIYPMLEVIVVSAHGDMEIVVKALRLGALDYIQKPFRHSDIQIAIERSKKFLSLQKRIKHLEGHNSLISGSLEEKINRQFIGISSQLRDVIESSMTAAKYPDVNVLITGESGTGKENIAKIIHYSSSRKDHVMNAINSCAFSDNLLESEFFGHKKGSFTGAIENKMGYFEDCDKGTLFLDEIGDMPLNLQAKILRVIEEKKITRVGDMKQISTDFRIISATNQDLMKKVDNKEFRFDLLQRLNTLQIHIPPLREHPEDIKPLLDHFLDLFALRYHKQHVRIDAKAIEYLTKYDFPGNVRELRNMTERALILCNSNILKIQDFSIKHTKGINASSLNKSVCLTETQPILIPSRTDLKTNEIELILTTLRKNGYNQTATAQNLGISRDALIRKMKKFHISISKEEKQN